jgi:DNA-binding PadR family transcriptional regulator
MHDHRFHHDNSEFPGAGFGRHGMRPPFGMHGRGRGFFGAHAGCRARRGDIRTAIVRLLSEQPMHGYQIIQELSTRSKGAWSPSAGSIYPALQLMADEGIVTSQETGGKKIFSLTEAGVALAAESASQPAPWDEAAEGSGGNQGYREAAGQLVQAVWQVGMNGSADQVTRATEIITDARKKIYAILAED